MRRPTCEADPPQVPADHKAFVFHGLLLPEGVRLGDLGIQARAAAARVRARPRARTSAVPRRWVGRGRDPHGPLEEKTQECEREW